ncbi:hypothetical protein EDD85DRAFT_117768 [Armillaria nabsnona]|nr:hypothetical protein EDD85DRAFT_117768 [Armillaria nabsnona]
MSQRNLNFRYFSIAVALHNLPTPMQMPPGYERVVPPSTHPSWGEVFPHLDTRYNIFYKSPDHGVPHQCAICYKFISPVNIRQHLTSHHGYSQSTLSLTCTDSRCGGLDLSAKSYPKHVDEQHCGIFFLCPYCGRQYTRGESVTRHIMDSCTAFRHFRIRGSLQPPHTLTHTISPF